MRKQLMRSTDDQILGGVCAGIGEYLLIDRTWVRLFFVLLAFGQGAGVWLYLVLWLIVPLEGGRAEAGFDENVRTGAEEISDRARMLAEGLRSGGGGDQRLVWMIGGGLIVFGIVILLDDFNPGWFSLFRPRILWPVLLILAGVVILVRRSEK